MKLTHIVAGTALLLSGFAAGSVAVQLSASATSNSMTFYSCSNIKSGVLSATSTKAPSCPKTATLVTWNSIGPQGASGTTGAPGATGPQGPAGPQGDTGAPATSLSGIQFVKGYVIQEFAYLSNAALSGANLTNVNLARANLTGASLNGVNLSGADLFRADLSNANLAYSNLTNANLTRANLSNANLNHTTLIGVDFTDASCPNGIVHGQSGANC